jgi:hypothetical protein
MMFIQKRNQTIIIVSSFILNCFAGPLLAQYAGGTGTVDEPFLIATAEQMNTIGLRQEHWSRHFKQIADIDLSAYIGEQFKMIGVDPGQVFGGIPFTGTFDGNGYEIRNFTYSSSGKRSALFEALGQSGELRNITMIDPVLDCPQGNSVAALVAAMGNSVIRNCRVLGGTIIGDWPVGGIVAQCWAGGGGSNNSKIINCHVTCDISANTHAGGIIGSNFGRVHNCSAAGTISGSRSIGGLVGVSDNQTSVTHCYATGQVTGNSSTGGLVGNNSGASVSDCFWDQDTSGQSVSAGGTGLTTAQMQDPTTYLNAGWDMEEIWMSEAGDYPTLQWASVARCPKRPTVVQAEEAVIEGGLVEDGTSGYGGTGYVNLLPDAANAVEWTVPIFTPGTKTLCLRYANGTHQDVLMQISVNGVIIHSQQVFQSTGAWDAWNSTGVCAYLNYGSNVIKLTTVPPFTGLNLDEVEILDSDTDLVFDRDLIISSQEAGFPAANAIDANCNTCWIAPGYPQWIEVDLGLVYGIHRTELVCMEDRAYQFKIEAKLSPSDPYILVVDRCDNEIASKLHLPIMDTFEAMPARFIRLTVTDAHDYAGTEVGIAEFSVFGTAQVPAISIGTQGYTTIQSAIGAAQNGDVIILNPGLYRENIKITNKTVELRSVDPNDPNSTILQGNMNEPVLTLSNNSVACEIVGLTLRGGSVGIMGTTTNATMRNCRIMDNVIHGLELFETSSPYLDHCLITDNGAVGILMHATNDRQALNCEPVLENCTIVDNGDAGIWGGKPVIVDSIIQEQ